MIDSLDSCHSAETYSEPCQTSEMERLVNIGKRFQPLNIFAKHSTLEVFWGSEYNSIVK